MLIEALAIFCIIAIVGVIASYFGHLIWLAISWMFSRIFAARTCPACGRELTASKRCEFCEAAAQSAKQATRRPTIDEDLQAAERLRQYARFQGWLDEAQDQYLSESLARLRQRISAQQPPQAAELAPAISNDESESLLPIFPTILPTDTHDITGVAHTSPVEAIHSIATIQPEPHALDADYEPIASESTSTASLPTASSTSVPMRAQVLRSFMERSNIRWVELISASLVIVCSVGLVISLWSTLSQTSRFFPSLVFMLATLAVHGAGQYTLSRWKLRTTSRGILHIGLMLIPLSVLVGILLAHRQGDQSAFEWNVGSILAVGVGFLIYSGLAITAARSLFSKHFWPIALCNILASAALLPIDLASTAISPSHLAMAGTLLPVVMVSILVSLLLSRQAAWRSRWTNPFARRHMGMAVQALFVSMTAGVFWYLKFKPSLSDAATAFATGTNDLWWFSIGLMGVAWSAWGWSISLARSSLIANQHPSPAQFAFVKPSVDRDASWFIVVGWILAMIATVAIAAGVWQANHSRTAMMLLVSIGGAWWIMHGVLNRQSLSLLVGSLALILAIALSGESIHLGWSESLQAVQWLSQERLTWLTAIGACVASMATTYLAFAHTKPLLNNASSQIGPERFDRFIVKHLTAAGFTVVLAAAGLTVLASCMPLGPTPFGGQWSAWYLACYGIALTATGIGLERPKRSLPSTSAPSWIASVVLPIGLAISILATVRFMHGSDLMPAWIVTLRPARAWSVGLTTLATAWAVLAVILTQLGWSSRYAVALASDLKPHKRPWVHSIDWLNLAAIGLCVISILGVVRLSDHLTLVARLYWQLPILCAAIWFSWRSTNARELVLLCSVGWCLATLFAVGHARDWWLTLPLSVAVACHVAISLSVCLLMVLATRYCIERRSALTSTIHAWMFQPNYWAAAIIVSVSMAALFFGLFTPAIYNLGLSLGLVQPLENNAPTLPLAFTRPTFLETTGVLGTLILWAATAWLGSRLPRLASLRVTLSLAPLLLAFALTACVSSTVALSVCLGVLAISLIAAEVMTLFSKPWAEHSESSWQQLSSLVRDSRFENNALLLGRWVTLSCLLGLTGLAIFLGWEGRLSTHLMPAVDTFSSTVRVDRWQRCLAILGWMWPALSCLYVRWLFAVARDVGANRVALIGYVLTVQVACVASLVGMASTIPFLFGAIAWLQWFVIAVALLAGTNAVATLLRNFVGLRAIDRGQSSSRTLLNKAAGGGRWKRAAAASHQLLWGGLACMLILCALAATSNVMVPIRVLESIAALAVWPTWLAYLLLTGVLTWLWRANEPRGQTHKWAGLASYASLIALLLGMLAPIGAVFYADWLTTEPSRIAVASQQFEPYRAQVVIWLAVLGIGLIMRWTSAQKRWPMSGEMLWVALALIVGCLSFVSSVMDPQPMWSVAELGALALVAVLSGCFSGQAWRGHLAALIAGAACLTWSRPLILDSIVDLTWLVLIGPLVVAAVSLAWHLFSQRNPSHVTLEHAATLQPIQLANNARTVDQTVSRHVPLVVCLLTCLWLFQRSLGVIDFDWPVATAVGVGGWLLAMARMWDTRRGGRGLAIYLSFIACSLTVSVLVSHFNQLPLPTRSLLWMAFGLGALAAVAGCLRQWLRESSGLIPVLRLGHLSMARADFDAARRWIAPWHATIGLLLVVPCVLLAVGLEERALRLANAALPLLSGLSILPIAIDAGQRISRGIGLWLVSIPLVLFLWADLSGMTIHSSDGVFWLYSQRTMVALVLLGWGHWALSQWLARKLDWPAQLYRSSWISFVGAVLVGSWMIVAEWSDVWKVAAHAADLASQLVWLIAWMALIGRALQFALKPMGLDTAASIKQRQLSVYAAELGLVMLSLSTYMCFPDLFGGIVADWWPLVVFGIAMLSAALGHWAAARDHVVIADPVRRSSLLLPLVPLLGVWLPFSRQLDIDWSDWQSYSLVLLSGAALYALHGWLKPSINLHTLAGVLGLLSFWALLHSRPSLRFFEHPQFWLVPPALATLIFVEANRRRLDTSVVTAVRYVAILLAYLSSTSEILLKAFEGQMWQPLVLLLLAVLGVLAGIALRVRAFLFCGATFVMVALLGMVWHAQQAIDQVWPWWAFGILTGVSLIAMLGYFEKNRPRVLAYVEKLKGWE